MRASTIVIFFMLGLKFVSAQKSTAFCTAFNKIVADMPNHFKNTKGETTGNYSYHPVVTLPGATIGEVKEEGKQDKCVFFFYKGDKYTDALNAYAKFKADMIQCMPSGWLHDEKGVKNDAGQEVGKIFTFYTRAESNNNGEIILKLEKWTQSYVSITFIASHNTASTQKSTLDLLRKRN